MLSVVAVSDSDESQSEGIAWEDAQYDQAVDDAVGSGAGGGPEGLDRDQTPSGSNMADILDGMFEGDRDPGETRETPPSWDRPLPLRRLCMCSLVSLEIYGAPIVCTGNPDEDAVDPTTVEGLPVGCPLPCRQCRRSFLVVQPGYSVTSSFVWKSCGCSCPGCRMAAVELNRGRSMLFNP